MRTGWIFAAALVADLMRRGYRRADLVTQVGDFAVRGGVFDLFSPGYDRPLRLDFFGDTVESIHHFDAQTQRSEDGMDEASLLPLSLFPSGGSAAAALADYFVRSGAAESAFLAWLRFGKAKRGSGLWRRPHSVTC